MRYGSLLSQSRKVSSVWTPSFYHFDALGSAAGLTNSSQTLTDSYLYKAYGELLAPSGSTTNAFRWVGRQGYYFDNLASGALNQYYVRARHYSPTSAQWLSEDLHVIPGHPNLYQYSISSPTTILDPNGFIPIAGTIPALCLANFEVCALVAVGAYLVWVILSRPKFLQCISRPISIRLPKIQTIEEDPTPEQCWCCYLADSRTGDQGMAGDCGWEDPKECWANLGVCVLPGTKRGDPLKGDPRFPDPYRR